MSEWQAIGPHRYRISSRIFWLETAGEFTSDQTHLLVDTLLAWQHQTDECGALVDVRGGVVVPAEARRVMAKRSAEGRLPLPMAVVGSALTTRAVLTMMATAVRLVLRKEVPIAFFQDENEAVKWLGPKIKERAERLRTLGASSSIR